MKRCPTRRIRKKRNDDQPRSPPRDHQKDDQSERLRRRVCIKNCLSIELDYDRSMILAVAKRRAASDDEEDSEEEERPSRAAKGKKKKYAESDEDFEDEEEDLDELKSEARGFLKKVR